MHPCSQCFCEQNKCSTYPLHGISQHHTINSARSYKKRVSHYELHLAATMTTKIACSWSWWRPVHKGRLLATGQSDLSLSWEAQESSVNYLDSRTQQSRSLASEASLWPDWRNLELFPAFWMLWVNGVFEAREKKWSCPFMTLPECFTLAMVAGIVASPCFGPWPTRRCNS